MRCDDAIRLIGRAEVGQVNPDVLDRLMAHLDQCPPCRVEAETQVMVKRVLASRPDEQVPRELSQRIKSHLDAVAAELDAASVGWRHCVLRWWREKVLSIRRKSDPPRSNTSRCR